MSRSGEFEWIARHFAPLSADGAFGLKDDAALLDVPDGQSLVVTQDAIMENVHFLESDPVETIAKKALRVNISDLIAKGAVPWRYSLALGVPDRWNDDAIASFAKGLSDDQQQYAIQLTGGDTFSSPERLCISVTMFGLVPKGSYVSRLGAREGDPLLVSGTIGEAALGLKVAQGTLTIEKPTAEKLLNAYRLPNPPFGLSNLIAEYATASMDVSDGLTGDAQKMCSASKLGAVIDRDKIPLSSHAQKILESDPSQWSAILGGGDDYQCLFTVPTEKLSAVLQSAKAGRIPIVQIGEMTRSDQYTVSLMANGVPLSDTPDSYSHF